MRAPVTIKASSGEVLPEHARPERLTELVLPPVEVLAGIGVDGLIVAAVMSRRHRSRRPQARSYPSPCAPGHETRTGADVGTLSMPEKPVLAPIMPALHRD